MNPFDFKAEYKALTSHFPNHKTLPVIGILGNFGDRGCELAEGYFRSIEAAGGIPMIVPPLTDRKTVLALLDRIDGLMISGGADINPLYLNEEPLPQLHGINPRRDQYELLITQLAADRNIPIFGICRGIQVIAAALGGRVCQDLAAEHPDTQLLKHNQDAPRHLSTHWVTAQKGSWVAQLLGERFPTNTFHHQAVDNPGPQFRATAFTADGTIEAIESKMHKSIFGVQWHPECYLIEGDECMMPLFRHFVKEADFFRQARELHREILTLDSHCDTPMQYEKGAELYRRDDEVCVDLHKMTEGGLDASVMVAYLAQEGRSDEELAQATRKADRILEQIQAQIARNAAAVAQARTSTELYRHKFEGKKSILLGIENGYAIGKDLSNLQRYKEMGVVYITLCHNGDNDICDSARRSNHEHHGLSDFGRKVVAEMNRLGIMIDLSHADEKTFYDVMRESKVPVICSHSSSRSCCNHPRNLTDDQLRAMAEKNGVVQVTFYEGFLREEEGASIDDAVRHLLHVIRVAGIDHTGIGSDFDGDGGVPGIHNAADFIHLTARLLQEGLSREDLRKLWGGNFIRVMNEVQKHDNQL